MQKPLIVAHRGSSLNAPENTLAAFKLAKDEGADAFEFDVHLTKDEIVIATHDYHFKRFGVNKKINELNFSEVKQIDVAKPLNPKFNKECAPTLGEIFELWKNNGTPKLIEIEIKSENIFDRRLEYRVLMNIISFHNAYASKDLINNLIIISFNPLSLFFFKNKLPQAKRGLLLSNKETFWKRLFVKLFWKLAKPHFIIPSKDMLTEDFIKKHFLCDLGVYTIENKNDYDKIKHFELWAITTNSPSFCKN